MINVSNTQANPSDGRSETLGVTPEHPFNVVNEGWVEAGKLSVGAVIHSLDGQAIRVQSVEQEAQRQDTYNFEVADFHTYFVGKNGVWVHNMCLPIIKKAVNSNLGHAIERAVERGVFPDTKLATEGLKSLTNSISKNGFPQNALRDTAHADRILVPIGNRGLAVYQVGKNGTAKLKTTLIEN